jgi:hypothetical protein
MSYVKAGFQTVAKVPSAGSTLRIKNYDSLDNVLYGKATRDDVDILIACFNISEAIAYLFPSKGGDWMAEIKAAQDAIFNMGKRGVSGRNFAFTALELQAVRLAMQVHDQQLEEITVQEIEQAMDFVAECIRLKKARPIVEAA